jgi:dCMP deaminase
MTERWALRYLDMAKLIASWSKDPSTKVGAVIVNPHNEIISLGYNGLPKGVKDSVSRLHDRETKLSMTVHAEQNALLFAHESVRDCTLYVYPFMPCSNCAGLIIQSGIKEVVTYSYETVNWVKSFEVSKAMFNEAGVKLTTFQEK